ncbi:MAG TPA: bacteriohemerythrin [Sedimenticola sp.]|nr:bacteriohemerythrin [Sedimenticola sp.]
MKEKLVFWSLVVALAVACLLTFVKLGAADVTPWLILVSLVVLVLSRWQKGRGKCESFLVWDDDYSVGIEAMDRDHQRLLNLINNLKAAMLCNTGEAFERRNLDELVDYTRTHLAKEEQLLQEHGYPDYEGHKAQHDQMISYVESYVRKYEQEGRKVLPEIADYLTLWLTDHINVTDKKYTAFLNAKGVH